METQLEDYDDFPGVKRDTMDRMTESSWLERLCRSTTETWECPECGYEIAPLEFDYILLDGHNRCPHLTIRKNQSR